MIDKIIWLAILLGVLSVLTLSHPRGKAYPCGFIGPVLPQDTVCGQPAYQRYQ